MPSPDIRSPTTISPGLAANIDRVLVAARSYLNMDVAFLSEFLGPNRIFRNADSARPNSAIRVGGILPIAAGYCQHVVEGRLPELIPNTAAIPLARTIPETRDIPIGAHLSVPVKLAGGRIFGTFCCFSHVARPDLDRRDLEVMRTFSHLVAHQIDAELAVEMERDEKEARIRAALANDDPNIVFQPVVQLADLNFVGVEALSRFATEPIRSPDQWFAEADEVGLAEGLELVAIRKAVIAAGQLPESLYLGVNASPATVMSGRLPEALKGFDLRRVVLEITEHKPIAEYEPMLAALKTLREGGARVAIDDAGAGYSSFRHVLNLRPDFIKLDVSLTRGIDLDPRRAALAAALVEFARRTRTAIVAEGIETSAELHTLRHLGIEGGQGYLFAKPTVLASCLAHRTPRTNAA